MPASHKADDAQLGAYIENAATLYALRTKFSVLLPGEAEEALAEDVRDIKAQGLATVDVERQRGDLLAEASYLATSLKYLILSGGAVWPTDRDAHSYANDALSIVGDMQDEILQGVAANSDIYPELYHLELVWAWTNGETEIDTASPLLKRDEWVAAALKPLEAGR